MPDRFWAPTILCPLLPDLDVIGFSFGVRYEDFLGHRGFSHSLTFAALVGLVVVCGGFRDIRRGSARWWGLWAYFFIITASNGLLDAVTNGGLGIAFFSPFDTTRYFLPWRPLEVSPISPALFFSRWGAEVLLSEAIWVWLPCLLLVVGARVWRRSFRGKGRETLGGGEDPGG